MDGLALGVVGAAILVLVGLLTVGVEDTNIAISVVTLLMVFVLQHTQNRDSAALHLKLDEIITHLEGPRDELAGVESKSHEEIEELRVEEGAGDPPISPGLVEEPATG